MKTITYFEKGDTVQFNKNEDFRIPIETCIPFNNVKSISNNTIRYEDQKDELIGKIDSLDIYSSTYTIHYNPTNVGGRKISEYAVLHVKSDQVIGLST